LKTSEQLARLIDLMVVLRRECPWDAEQTHRSLVQYLVEETLEVVEAIESGDKAHLQEELGDVLLQVVFHAQIASEDESGFTVEDVAKGIADKLVARHPHVFLKPGAEVVAAAGTGSGSSSAGPVSVADLNVSWEERKAIEKGRTSVLEGIPAQMSALAKANKILSRARSGGVAVELPTEPISYADLGDRILELVARAHGSGIDPEQAVRDAVRTLEARIRAAEPR
jgi:XTP/dITP diphosphohydrolase